MITDPNPLVTFFEHHKWSNERMYAACEALDEEQLSHADIGAFGSIKATLAHISGADERYMQHLSGGAQYGDMVFPDGSLPMTELIERGRAAADALLDEVRTNDPNRIVKTQGTGTAMPAITLILQSIHHGHEHRTQICSMLGQLGVEPPDMSSWTYFEDVIRPKM